VGKDEDLKMVGQGGGRGEEMTGGTGTWGLEMETYGTGMVGVKRRCRGRGGGGMHGGGKLPSSSKEARVEVMVLAFFCSELSVIEVVRAECGLVQTAEGLEGSKGWGVVSCKEMGEAPVCGVGQALKDEDIRAERGERRRGEGGELQGR
jgi:hypothetical protein